MKGHFTMNKTTLIEKVAKETGLKRKEVEAVVNATFAGIEAAILEGEKVQIVGFGTFEVKDRPERTGINPATRKVRIIILAILTTPWLFLAPSATAISVLDMALAIGLSFAVGLFIFFI